MHGGDHRLLDGADVVGLRGQDSTGSRSTPDQQSYEGDPAVDPNDGAVGLGRRLGGDALGVTGLAAIR